MLGPLWIVADFIGTSLQSILPNCEIFLSQSDAIPLQVRWEEERGETFPPCFLFHQYSPCVVNEHQHKYTHWGFWNAPCTLSPDHLCLCNLLQQHCTYSLTLLKSCLHSLYVLYAYSFFFVFVLPITVLGAVLFTVGLSFSFVVLIRCCFCVKGVEYLFHCVLFQSKKWFQGKQAGRLDEKLIGNTVKQKQEHERRTLRVCKHACLTAGVWQLGKREKRQRAGGGQPVMRRWRISLAVSAPNLAVLPLPVRQPPMWPLPSSTCFIPHTESKKDNKQKKAVKSSWKLSRKEERCDAEKMIHFKRNE